MIPDSSHGSMEYLAAHADGAQSFICSHIHIQHPLPVRGVQPLLPHGDACPASGDACPASDDAYVLIQVKGFRRNNPG